MRAVMTLATAAMLAGCGGETARPVSAESMAVTRAPVPSGGVDRMMGLDAAQLTRTFGVPAADLREGTARKLQFQGPICVLDAYLYPKDGREAVTHIDARQRDGSPIDRASCVAALSHHGAAK
ncbi:MAG: hypothetical protein J0I47_06835 [Sphingomonas sp.]|uniref:hypothetical protein n=1 Tax=Sphingomonas sp. TaxID=28214 RepID=UPI001ACBFF01|nr:hypothetical protein [Sphingomonas sp.]MBN8807936.1 hypothetical protein [Sphingomonas sp.]